MERDPEILERTRRIETRLTKYFEHIGFDSGTRKPCWQDGKITLPSLDVSFRSVMNAVPANVQGSFEVVYKDQTIAHMVRSVELKR